ncbi:hypothetical protein GCM10009796_24670 [Microbacterium koreense]
MFLDFDGDGVFDTGNTPSSGIPNDQPVADVTVAAYDSTNGQVGAAVVTSATGTYAIDTGSVPDGTPLRIEFTGLPASSFDGFHGEDSGTSVQFVDAGAENVDFSVVVPAYFSSPGAAGEVPLVQSIQRGANRNATGGGAAANVTQPSVVSIPWNVPDNRGAADIPATWAQYRTTIALTPQTGSLGGSTFDRVRGNLFAAAEFRRFADLGPLGLGGIYIIEDVLKADGTIESPSDLTADIGFVDVATLGVDVGQSLTELQPNALTAVARGLGDTTVNPATFTAQDPTAYEWAGRAGIGGIAMSSDSSLLYFVNRFDSRLYALALPADLNDAPTLAGTWDLGLAADDQASAIVVDEGTVYVGVVGTGGQLSAALPGDVADPGSSTATGSLRVYSASETDGALRNGASFSQVLSRNLATDYPRGVPIMPSANDASTVPDRFKVWHNWTNEWDAATFTVLPRTNPGISWSQPILSDLEMTADGYLVLTLSDRFALQNGVYNIAPTGGGTLYYAFAQGDVLVASPTLHLEDDGEVAGLTRTWTNTTNLPTQGVGGGEFFDDNVDQGGWRHDENGLGWSASFPGVDQIATSAYDPVPPNLDVAGVRFQSASGGVAARGFIQTTPTGGFFQKAGGLGSVSLLLNEAPVEIGNRVWLDADLNGRQDPDEPAINGAPVDLFAADAEGTPQGTALASTVTAAVDGAPGTYYFSSVDTEGLEPDGEYVVVFGTAAGTVALAGENATHPGFAGLDWGDLRLTRQMSDLAQATTDSNPDPTTGEAPVSVGGPGENDHSIDAGFVAFGSFTVDKVLDAGGATPVEGQVFTVEVTEAVNFRGEDRLGAGSTYVYPSDTAAWNPAWVGDWAVTPTEFSFEIIAGEPRPVGDTSPQKLPVGYSLTLVEADADNAADVRYEPPSTAGDAAKVLITPADGRPITVTVTNTLLPDGSFTIEKLLDGDPAAMAAASDVRFRVTWTSDTGPRGEVVVTGGQISEAIVVPAGSTVTVAEAEPDDLPSDVRSSAQSWTGDGVETLDDGSARFVVESDASIAVSVTNTVTDVPPMPTTGSEVPWWMIVAGSSAIALGALALMVGHRRARAARL